MAFWSFQLCKALRKQSVYVKRLRHFQVKQNCLLICLPMYFSRTPLLLPCSFSCITKELQSSSLRFATYELYVTQNWMNYTKLCDVHLSACQLFVQILSNSSHFLHNDLTRCHSCTGTRSTSCIKIYSNSTIPYLVRILINRKQITTDFSCNLSWISNFLFFGTFCSNSLIWCSDKRILLDWNADTYPRNSKQCMIMQQFLSDLAFTQPCFYKE